MGRAAEWAGLESGWDCRVGGVAEWVGLESGRGCRVGGAAEWKLFLVLCPPV